MTIGWLQVSMIGRSKFVQSMSIWMMVTPVTAKILGSIDTITLGIIGSNAVIPLSLPFSWKVFFYCSLSFAIGNAIHAIFAPEIIKRFRNYTDFQMQEDSLYFLVEATKRELEKKAANELGQQLQETVMRYTPDEKISNTWSKEIPEKWLKGVDSLKHSGKENQPDIFSSFRLTLSSERGFWMWLCAAFYFIGFAGLLYIIWQNLFYVLYC